MKISVDMLKPTFGRQHRVSRQKLNGQVLLLQGRLKLNLVNSSFTKTKNGKNFPFSIIPQRSKLLSRLFNSCFQTSIEKWPGLPWRDRPRRWRMRSWWRRWRMGDVGAEDHGWLNHWLSVLSALICTFSLRLNWVDQLMFVFLVGLRYKEETAVGILSEENDGEHFAL